MKMFPGTRLSLVCLVILAGCSPAASGAPSLPASAVPPTTAVSTAPTPTPATTPGPVTLDSCLGRGLPGGRIAFTVGDGNANGIGVMNADGTDFRIVVGPKVIDGQPHGGTEGPSWAGPETILFDSNRNGGPDDWHIFRVNQSGGDPIQVTRGGDGIENYAVLAPDGRFIAYSKYLATGEPSEPFGGGGIFIADPDGRHERQVTQAPAGGVDEWPDIAPDGTRIAFSRGAGGDAGGLFVVNTDGTGLERIVTAEMQPLRPRWSTDGTRILFHDNADRFLTESANVWVINPDGTALRQLTFESGGNSGGQAFDATWSPDDRFVLFVHHLPRSGTNDLGVVSAAGGDICTLWRGTSARGAWESDWQAADLAPIEENPQPTA